jgi:hypothetical protein
MDSRAFRVAIFAVLLGLTVGSLACSPVRPTYVPAELVDVWVTDNAKYADRYFTIRGTTLTFGTGGDTSESYIITNVERVPFVGDSLYTIEYVNSDGDPYRFSFFFRQGNPEREQPDEIRLANQRHFAWVRRR